MAMNIYEKYMQSFLWAKHKYEFKMNFNHKSNFRKIENWPNKQFKAKHIVLVSHHQ